MTEIIWYKTGRRPVTPWGAADSRQTFGLGVSFYSTPSHGGFYVDRTREAVLDERLREVGITAKQARFGYPTGWYEEDCAALAVVFAFPELFPRDDPQEALDQLRYWLTPAKDRNRS